MERISAKGFMYSLLPVLLMLQLVSLVGAVDITFYESNSTCNGLGYSFNSIGPQICCVVSAKDGGSVLVTSTSGSSDHSVFYRGGSCNTTVGTGQGNFCLLGGQFTGAFWFHTTPPTPTPAPSPTPTPRYARRSLLSDASCNSQMKPTGIVYTDAATNSHWTLPSSNAEELYSQMKNIPDGEKLNWLYTQGASYMLL